MALLDLIEGPNDIKKLQQNELDDLAEEIRRFLVRNVSMTGGHLASNLGVVELTMALHLSLDLPNDKIVWDVGHQSYTHKILTGRKDGFERLRQYGGISGFPKRAESECDVYDSGHSSTSISAALGMARARDLLGEKRTIVAVIGDGALTGGVAYEALNDVAQMTSNLIIILNDNNITERGRSVQLPERDPHLKRLYSAQGQDPRFTQRCYSGRRQGNQPREAVDQVTDGPRHVF